jgi:hypothetical protein
MPFDTAPRCPEPQSDHQGRRTLERKWKHALAYVSQLWRPANTQEQTHCTVARYAMHLIDLTTGAAYTVQQLLNTVSVTWSSITGKPTTLSGYGITDAAALTHTHSLSDVSGVGPAAITRTAEQGAPNKNGVEVAKVGGPFIFEGFYPLMSTEYNGHPVFSNIEENGNFRRVIFRSVGGRWRNISGVAIDLDDQDTWEASVPDFSSQSTTSALPYPALVWRDDDDYVDADLAVSAASTTPVTPSAIGQLCIVDASDVYVAAQVSPPIWLGPLNS